ncbi:MAG: bifunctional phosphopantothenoylcysteine decarboxylase/phosphopantothenate--cysteine ligase CoaBC [Candidatus Electrothrix sp. AR4]|nr:bifunctional phosphopantothenoylcysteine decarboxylase/phosphopantothenate--cysteine ligase CoaBC [Candidatus Electrothrix sp. AR4]
MQGQKILFGVTGSIAAFKAAGWVHALIKEEARVTVVMTESATRFVAPLTFGALSGNQVYTDMFGLGDEEVMSHITLSAEADLVLIAPATAQTIARLAHGMADDLLSTTVLASSVPVVVCPAMNSKMLLHPATQRNLTTLRKIGYTVVEPECGQLACGEVGTGRLAEWDTVRETLLGLLLENNLAKHHILITAGPTREPLDPARYLSNRSSGKMGYALARTAKRRGAQVTLISGPVHLAPPPGITVVPVETADEMAEAVKQHAPSASIVVKAAAVADFRPKNAADQKIKKATAEPLLELTANPDILADLGKQRGKQDRSDQLLVGFAAESDNHEAEGRRKLLAKNVDLMVVNDILGDKTGFDVDTNQVTLITREASEQLALLSKEETANGIWDKVASLYKAKRIKNGTEQV